MAKTHQFRRRHKTTGRGALRIAFDVDGVLADLDAALLQHRNSRLDEQGSVSRVVTALKVLSSTRKSADTDMWKEIKQVDAFWESLRETEPGCVAKVARVARQHRWEVISTRRPESAGDTAQRQTQRWLQTHGFEHPSVFVVQGSRGSIAAALDLDAVVDDTVENCLDVASKSSARPILVWRRQTPPLIGRVGIQVVATIDECIEALSTH